MLLVLADLDRLDLPGPLQAAFSHGEQIQPGAAVLLLQGTQIGKEAAALGPTEPQPGLSPLQSQALLHPRGTGHRRR